MLVCMNKRFSSDNFTLKGRNVFNMYILKQLHTTQKCMQLQLILTRRRPIKLNNSTCIYSKYCHSKIIDIFQKWSRYIRKVYNW